MSVIKFMVLSAGTALMNFMILFAVCDTIAVGLLVMYKSKFEEQGADITPFLGLFVLETAAWYAIIMS